MGNESNFSSNQKAGEIMNATRNKLFAFDVSVLTLLPQRTLLSDHGSNDFMTKS